MVQIVIDGACSGNPGPGGWAAIIVQDDVVKEIGGYQSATTNNRMELMAAIEGLRQVPAGVSVEVLTDSQYLLKGITEWLPSWKERDWRTASGSSVENRDLWEKLDQVVGSHVTWQHVRGHAGHPLNERANKMAQAYAQGKTPDSSLDLKILKETGVVYSQTGGASLSGRPTGVTYLSLLDGTLMRHSTWNDCEARVKGQPARYKKCNSAGEELTTVISWGLDANALTSLEQASSTTVEAIPVEPATFQRPPGTTYLSLVDDIVARHTTWVECQARINGVSGAKQRKCQSLAEELKVLSEWGLNAAVLVSLSETVTPSTSPGDFDPTTIQRPAGTTYLSLIEGQLARHLTWEDCRRRVEGVSSPLFKKCKSVTEELAVVQSWGLLPAALLALNATEVLPKPSISTLSAPAKILLCQSFLPEAKRLLIEAGFAVAESHNPSVAFRLHRGPAIIEAYATGIVQTQGTWDESDFDLWRTLSTAEEAWLTACKTTGPQTPVDPVNWDEAHCTYLLMLLAHDGLPGWSAEQIGRYWQVRQIAGNVNIGVLTLDGWRHPPDTAEGVLLWHSLMSARWRPSRFCAAQSRRNGRLSVALIPLTALVQFMDKEWGKARDIPQSEQDRLRNQIQHFAGVIKVKSWTDVEWREQVQLLGNELDLIYTWLGQASCLLASEIGLPITWPIEIIIKASGNLEIGQRLLEHRTNNRISSRSPLLTEEKIGEAAASFLAYCYRAD